MKWLSLFVSITLAVLFTTLIIFYFGFTLFLENTLSSKVSTKISIQNSSLSLNSVTLNTLRIYNPQNMQEPYALEIGSTMIQAPLFNYFKKIVEINLIELDTIYICIELLTQRKGGSNWNIIMQSVNSKGAAAPKETDTSYANIDLLSLKNITVVLFQDGKEKTRKTIPALSFQNIKTKKGELTRRITQAILYYMLFDFKNFLDFPLDVGSDAVTEPLNFFDKLLPH